MGIETMGIDRTRYRKRRRTMDELESGAMTKILLWYCLKQGAIRGFLYGAAYGAFFFIFGAVWGCIYGCIAGITAGLLNGAVLSAINAIQRQAPREEQYFLWIAARVGPWLTAIICYVLFRLLLGPTLDNRDQLWWAPDYLYDLIPAVIAAFAAWQAARKMEDWYFE